ncbi:MAG TPA: class I SAM-dependent methyltransferase [Puia sp.]|nr:class I SAM-dependent methyltransferase [Puia sp.]
MLSLLQTAERTTNTVPVGNYVYQRHAFAYVRAIDHIGDNVIELGCGSGYGMQMLAPSCSWYVGLDKYIPQNRSASINTAFFKARFPDLRNIGDNSFDTVICFQVIEHIKKDGRLLEEARRVLKPGGRLLLTTPNRRASMAKRSSGNIMRATKKAWRASCAGIYSISHDDFYTGALNSNCLDFFVVAEK